MHWSNAAKDWDEAPLVRDAQALPSLLELAIGVEQAAQALDPETTQKEGPLQNLLKLHSRKRSKQQAQQKIPYDPAAVGPDTVPPKIVGLNA